MKKSLFGKVLALMLALALCLSMAACGKTESSSVDAGENPDFTGQTFVVGYFGNLPDLGDCMIFMAVLLTAV